MNSVILEYKAKGANTSEELFGIDQQPEENCPYINKCISDISISYKDVKSELKQAEDEALASLLEWGIDGMHESVEYLEELRSRINNLRQWGQQWKDLAKEMFELLPKEQQKTFVSNKFLEE